MGTQKSRAKKQIANYELEGEKERCYFAGMKGRSEKSKALAPEKMRPWHQTIADMWIAEPTLKQGEIARRLGKTEAWVSVIVNCDAFQEYLVTKKEEIVDPVLKASVEERFRAVANVAADRFLERMALGAYSNKDLLEAMKISSTGLGMGPAAKQPTVQNNLYVIPAPPRPKDATEWVQEVQHVIGNKS